ncbi:MAG: prepilin-type N-terminal cleavage/methylation domain-containing protein [Defluviitaleaceae bacterium]|nr:prepilin-type N-terminal cleavage/methylation domain-containing protein [Defluviitaleaceae bacterium]
MKSRAGVTLLELTIALAIFSIIAGVILVELTSDAADRRALQNAAVRLQADMRYAQRRAVMEGRIIYVNFYAEYNRYSIYYEVFDPIRTVDMDVNLFSAGFGPHNAWNETHFLPRGTSGRSGTIALRNGNLEVQITVLISGGQVRIGDILPLTTPLN